MSNVLKSRKILQDNDSGGLYIVAGKVIDSDERNRLTRQAIADDDQCVDDAIKGAENFLKHSIGKSRKLLDRAENESQTVVAQAKKQGFSQGYEEGFKLGLSEGMQNSLDEKQPLVEDIKQLSQKLSEYYAQPEGKNEYVDSTFKLAKRIISIELAKNDDAYFGLFLKAARHIGNVDKATLKAGPRGYAVAQANKSKFEGAIEGLGELNIKLEGKDDGLCVLETPLGNIDASVEAQLSRAKKIISPEK